MSDYELDGGARATKWRMAMQSESYGAKAMALADAEVAAAVAEERATTGRRIEEAVQHFRDRARLVMADQENVEGAAWHYGMGVVAIYDYAADHLEAVRAALASPGEET